MSWAAEELAGIEFSSFPRFALVFIHKSAQNLSFRQGMPESMHRDASGPTVYGPGYRQSMPV